jgi:hypothetical protein
MNIDLSLINTTSLVVVPIIIAIVQAIKLTGFVKDHYAPLVSILVGIIIGFLANHNSADLTATLLSGAVYGLMASGLYSGITTTMQATKAKKMQSQNQEQCGTDPNNH